LTNWVNGPLTLALKEGEPLVVPLYSAVMVCGLSTADSAEVVQLAVLPLNVTAEQITSGPTLNVTLPTLFGFAGLAVTVAVKVTLVP
jgi:hypothetical protein